MVINYKKISNRMVGIICCFIAIVLSIISYITNCYTISTYLLILIAITLGFLFFNKFKLISAPVLFLLFYIYAVALGPVILMHQNRYFSYNYQNIILVTLICFFIGNILATYIKKDRDKKLNIRKIKLKVKISKENVLYLLYVVSLICSAIYFYKNRIFLFYGNIETGRIDAISGNGVLLYGIQIQLLIIPMLYDIYFDKKINNLHSKKDLIILCVLICISTCIMLFTGFRSNVMTLFVILFIMYAGKKNIKAYKIILVGIVFVIILVILSIIRSNEKLKFIQSTLASFFVNDINLQYVFNTFPSKVEFQHGYTYLINILMLRPGPDLDFTLWLKQQIGLSFSGGGVTPTILGEFYINFGMLSMYLGMFLLGIASVKINNYFEKNNCNFLSSFYIWQFAHCISGGIANVMIIVILFTILYTIIEMLESKKD